MQKWIDLKFCQCVFSHMSIWLTETIFWHVWSPGVTVDGVSSMCWEALLKSSELSWMIFFLKSSLRVVETGDVKPETLWLAMPTTLFDEIDVFCSSASGSIDSFCVRFFFFEAMCDGGSDPTTGLPWTTARNFRLTSPLASAGGVPEPSAPPLPPQGMTSSRTPGIHVVQGTEGISPGAYSTDNSEGRTSEVRGEVLEVNVQNKRFKVIEPTIPNLPGGPTHPYPTSDIRRAMAQPSCTLLNVDGREMYKLYGYFWKNAKNEENWFKGEGVGKSQQPPGNKYISLRVSPAECLDRSTWGSFWLS